MKKAQLDVILPLASIIGLTVAMIVIIYVLR